MWTWLGIVTATLLASLVAPAAVSSFSPLPTTFLISSPSLHTSLPVPWVEYRAELDLSLYTSRQ